MASVTLKQVISPPYDVELHPKRALLSATRGIRLYMYQHQTRHGVEFLLCWELRNRIVHFKLDIIVNNVYCCECAKCSCMNQINSKSDFCCFGACMDPLMFPLR